MNCNVCDVPTERRVWPNIVKYFCRKCKITYQMSRKSDTYFKAEENTTRSERSYAQSKLNKAAKVIADTWKPPVTSEKLESLSKKQKYSRKSPANIPKHIRKATNPLYKIAVDNFHCDVCGAEVGSICRKSSGKSAPPHAFRLEQARKLVAEKLEK